MGDNDTQNSCEAILEEYKMAENTDLRDLRKESDRGVKIWN